MREALLEQLIDHEGLRLMPYTDSVGKLTIGVGRNLTDKGISEPEALLLLDHDVDECIADLAAFPWFGRLNAVRQMALIDLRFNLGADGFRGFKHMIHYLAIDDCTRAAAALQESKWFTQVGRRGKALVSMIATGTALLLLLASPTAAQTPEQIVGRERAKFGATVSPADAPTLLRAIARDLTDTLGTPYGLLPKTAGNQCGGYACDIICNAGFHWDVFEDGPDATTGYAGAAKPRWGADGPVPRACELVAGGLPPVPVPTPTPGPAPVPAIDLSAVLSKLDAIYQQNERIYADETNQRTAQTATLKAAIDEPGFLTKVFGNRYVQLALAGIGTYLMTAQVKK